MTNPFRVATAVVAGGVAVILDSTIVAVALHQLATDLHADVGTIQWVSTAYLLALGVVIPVVGWLQSRAGAKRLWMAALALFLLGSVLCAFAWDAPSLIAFRVVQGIGGGAMLPLMTTMVVQATSEADRNRVVSVVALPAAIGPILGPVIGGLILGAGSWRWLFLVNVPLCLIGLFLAWKLIPADIPSRRVRLDARGFALLSPALVALLWGLSNAAGSFLRADVLIPLAVGTALLVAFVLRALRLGSGALVDLGVLRSRSTWAASSLLFLSGAALYGAMFLLPLYWQQVRGSTALEAGLLLIPQGVGSLLSRVAAGSLLDRVGARGVAMAGFVMVGAATVPFAFAGEHTTIWPLMIALFVRGLGLGIVLIPLMTVAFVGLPHEKIPHASIVTRIAQQVGGSAGVALPAVILAGSGSFDAAFWWTIGFTAVAVVLSFALPHAAVPPRSGAGQRLDMPDAEVEDGVAAVTGQQPGDSGPVRI
ncbi:MDR family MFS transporter [Paractinoplanes atraurantiacus]|uniref:Drug resistance transporter, EmrB/QacA subfamily n=1 Tax=Paractinoplanes atraurantiacus TaxID=1036182 RepID=A0A285IPX1_9ACTN|nr:MDR family MFS transporter [Actinoplanes atraurantiacus]SNY49001.1 drug resistance transporter, EmrB/QacA subfamily [Actinoplanes atraurantiacus]